MAGLHFYLNAKILKNGFPEGKKTNPVQYNGFGRMLLLTVSLKQTFLSVAIIKNTYWGRGGQNIPLMLESFRRVKIRFV